jgi:Domain of unknown function (DUF5134)
MTGQAWVGYPLAGVMVATAVYCLARIVTSVLAGRLADRWLDATHVLMALTMAAMLTPSFALPWPAALQAVFGAGAALFGWRAVRSQQVHPLQHALLCAAMVYMLGRQQAAQPAAMAGPGPVALVLALGLLGWVVWSADRLTALPSVAAAAGGGATAVPLSLRLAAGCDVAMGVTMGYMLIVMR